MNEQEQTDNIDAIVLIRGLVREQQHWLDFTDKLQQRCHTIPVICLDVAGNGTEYKRASAFSIAELRSDLANRFQQQYPSYQAVALFAISMGGMLAIDWALAEPHKIKKIFLVNSSMAGVLPFYQRLRWQNYPKLLCLLWAKPIKKEAIILELTSNKFSHYALENKQVKMSNLEHAQLNQKKHIIIKAWLAIAKQRPVHFINLIKQLIAAAQFKITNSPNAETIIIAAKEDRLVSVNASILLAKRWPKAKLIIAEQGGHDLALDQADWLIEQVCNQLGNNKA